MYMACRDISFKVTIKSLIHLIVLAHSTNKKEAQSLVGQFGFWSQHIPVLLWPILQTTQKATSFVWGLEQKKSLQHIHKAVQAIYHLGHVI